MKNVLVIIFCSIAVVLVSCKTDSTTETENSSPEIQSVTANPSTIGVGETTVLTCVATDVDGDDLSYTWTDDVGGLPVGELGSIVTWKAPNNDGAYTIHVIVRDSENSTTAKTQVVVNPGACGSTIAYEGKTYNTVQVGTQCWMKENLDVGTMIQGDIDASDNGIIEKYCYNNNPANCEAYGALYNWNEINGYISVSGTQGICPEGWHIPTKAELETLVGNVGNDGNALKEVGQGVDAGAGTNTSGFSALLAGDRGTSSPYFNFVGTNTSFWGSDVYSSSFGDKYRVALDLYQGSNNAEVGGRAYYDSFSLRCIKD